MESEVGSSLTQEVLGVRPHTRELEGQEMLVREGGFAMAASEVSGGVGGRHGGGGKQVEELRVEGRDGSSHKHCHHPERWQTGEDANDPGITDQSRVGGGGVCGQETCKASSGEGGTAMTALKELGLGGESRKNCSGSC